MKHLVQSKVFWVAVLQGIFGIILVLETEVPELGWVAIAKSVLDVGLRFVTSMPVTIKREKRE